MRTPVVILWSKSADSPEPTRPVTARSSPGSHSELPVTERRTTDADQHHTVALQRHVLHHGRGDLRAGDGVLPGGTVFRTKGQRGRGACQAAFDGTGRRWRSTGHHG